jgi:uncharacterized membrane protein YfcA
LFELTPVYILLLPPLGLVLAALGTLCGLGGGFVLVPVLLVLFPGASPAVVSSISLTVVLLNAASATIGNIRARRIDLRTAALLTSGAVPAAFAGAWMSARVSRERFEDLFGFLLLAGAVYVLWRAFRVAGANADLRHEPNRLIQERRGPVYRFYVNTVLAGIISPVAGFLSSFFGIGGGVVHVPAMTFILKMPTRVVSATALLVLVPTAAAGVAARVLAGEYTEGWRRAGLLGLGAIIGAQLGIYLSARVDQRVVLIVLATSMTMVGLRQVLAGI